ncbi:plus-3-domain-containing protein [Dendrothele bispora CBS 962.96]|uniref:Plus-3-domain-containing protein n=1 Tax=Dendrothele bispora (strain CBS 962.96) TaxID=1314807 RepID=A0A4S8M1H4_DENBC|nr:plus-3-domain-containing protein [Dendrothele bispora CBS 962.96]
MSEFDREDILAQRMEEVQKIKDKRAISQMVNAQRTEPDGVAKAAKRQHTARGSTKEKTRKLDELRARRKAKDEKKQSRGSGNSPKRERSETPMDMETSDEEDEDGMISKIEQEEEREAKLFGKPTSTSVSDNEPTNMTDLENIRLTRGHLAKHCMAPWFEEYVKGAWVRYLIGNESGQPVYRICEIVGLSDSKPYKIDGVAFDKHAELKHGKASRTFPLDRVSNSGFLPKEYERLTKTYNSESIKLPTKAVAERKRAELRRLETQPMTEETDLNHVLARKNALSTHRPAGWVTYERSRLVQERTLAQRRQDLKELEEIDRKIAEFDAEHGTGSEATSTPNHDNSDVLSKLSEKNRKANAEAVRRAEAMEAERRRRERKLALAGNSGTATPTDPSARLRMIPRTFNAVTPNSRPATPNPSTPGKTSEQAKVASPASTNGKSFESSVIQSLEVDLGDF